MRKQSDNLAMHIRPATVGDWKSHLGESHLEIFRRRNAARMRRLGYEVIGADGDSATEWWGHKGWRVEIAEAVQRLFQARDATISWLHLQVAKRDDTTASLRSEIAKFRRPFAE